MTTTEISTVTALDLTAIDRADLQPRTQWKYKREIEKLYASGVDPLDHEALAVYADGLKSSRRSFLKSALRLMTQGYENALKSHATPANIAKVQAGVYRLESMRGAISVKARKGVKVHTWLSQSQVTDITSLCTDDLEGKRDWIVLGLLLGAGLRREELAGLTFEALKQVPTKRGKMRHVLEVKGKGAKDRVIPISEKLAGRLQEWREIVGGGKVARSLGMSKTLGSSISGVGIFKIVSKYGARIGMPELAPHDLRRTFAQLAYDAKLPLTEISVLLGHSNVAVTQRYLDLSTNFEVTASDFVPLAGD